MYTRIKINDMISFNDIKHLFPVRIDKETDFKDGLKKVLKEYCSLLEQKGETISVITFCKEISKQILNIINNIHKGAHSTAYSQLANILNDKNEKYGISINDLLYVDDGYFYRMRYMDERRDANYKELFHIPFTKREKVTTERYSFPGLPCLYLGSSIYVCWEEMGRPDFSRVMISAMKSKRKMKLLDLRAPIYHRWDQTSLISIPLVLACQIVVNNKDAKFKNEYIIPQLMMEYIITNHEEIDGIIFSSVFKDMQFDFPADKYYNIALPAIQRNNEIYSTHLTDLFAITDPTCEEYERLNRHIGVNDISDTIEKTFVLQNMKYEISIFNEIEKSLKNESLFPLRNITE